MESIQNIYDPSLEEEQDDCENVDLHTSQTTLEKAKAFLYLLVTMHP